MAKKLKYNSDFMSEKMDQELEQIEDKLSALYANTAFDVNQKFADYAKTFEKDDKAMAMKVETGEITNEEYSLWRQRHIVQTDLYKATVDSLTDIMVSSDVMAMALVDGALPAVIAQSYNFTQSLGWASADASGLTVGNFQIYNADSVQAILKENKNILPVVDVPVDKRWNHDKINKEIASSIIKGDPIQKVAENLQKVVKMDENSAIRNARTAMTSAENLGRTESAKDLKQNGVPVEEVWQATYDNRVRDTHLMMDGTKRSENGTFGDDILETPLKYPADPDGDPEEIYNCRCRLGVVLFGIDHSKDAELYEQFMKEKYPESYEKMQENKGYQAKQEQIAQAQERKERLLEAQAEEKQAETENVLKTNQDYQSETSDALKDIYEQHRIENDLHASSAEDLPDDFFKAYYGNIDSESAKTFNDEIVALSQKYDTSLQEVRLMDKMEYLAKKDSFAYTYHNYEVDKTTLVINPAKFADNEAMIERINELIEKGYAVNVPPEEAYKYVVTHEFAHTLLDMETPLNDSRNWVEMDYAKVESARSEIEEIYSKYIAQIEELENEKGQYELDYMLNFNEEAGSKARDLIDEINSVKISQYSMLNADEFMAECFTISELGTTSNPYVAEVVDVINKYYGR